MTDAHPRVVVSNPGGRPELAHAAAGVARAGMLRRYVTPIGFAVGGRGHALAPRVPGRIGGQITRAVNLRTLPPGVERSVFTSAGALGELGLYVARDRNERLRRAATSWRDARFDSGLVGTIESSDDLLISHASATVRSLERAHALGVKSLLNYPIAHHDFQRRILHEEMRRVPDFAPTIRLPREDPRAEEIHTRELQLADHVLGLSRIHIETFLEAGVPEHKFIRVPLGVDTSLFHPLNRDDEAETFRVIFVGQISQRKGLSYLLDGFAKARIPNSELLLVGNVVGTSAPWIGLPGVRHVPHVARADLPRIYATASVFVMPSLIEGFCLTAMEALACGLPSIVSEHTFGDPVVRDGIEGWTIPIRDSGSIAERLDVLARDPELRVRMSQASRARALEYSWDAYEAGITAAIPTLVA